MQDLLYEWARTILTAKGVVWEEKRMMGGTTFMVEGKLCFGGLNGGLLCRIDPAERASLLERAGAKVIRQGDREMKGYVHVQPEGIPAYEDLEFWIQKCLEFNPKAKASKKRGR